LIDAELGAYEAARSHAELAMIRANELGQVILQSWSLSVLTYLHVRHQEGGLALELCRQGIALYAPTENRVAPLFLGAIAAEALLGAGRLDEAAKIISAYLALTRETGAIHNEAVALRVQGQILTAQERWDKADHSFDAAIVRLDELGSRLELGRVLYQRDIMRAALGQMDSARADARRALSLRGMGRQR